MDDSWRRHSIYLRNSFTFLTRLTQWYRSPALIPLCLQGKMVLSLWCDAARRVVNLSPIISVSLVRFRQGGDLGSVHEHPLLV